MDTRKLQLLLHPLFIVSLACLLINDLYWKYEYHNWLTGKLSDFAGLFVLSVFLSAFFFRRRPFVYLCVAVFFIWWKSPLSQPLLDLPNQSFSFSFHRTVDYTDYIAIPVVFAASLLKQPVYSPWVVKQVVTYFISAVCLFAFCSTSMIRKFMIAPDFSKRISYHKDYRSRYADTIILHTLDSMQLNYKIDSFTIAPLQLERGSLLIRKKDSLDKNWMVIDPMQKDTVVYVRINEWRPYIAIYNFNAGGEIFPQVNISVDDYTKATTIRLKSIYLNDRQMEEYYSKMSRTKKRFRKLIEKELIRKLQ